MLSQQRPTKRGLQNSPVESKDLKANPPAPHRSPCRTPGHLCPAPPPAARRSHPAWSRSMHGNRMVAWQCLFSRATPSTRPMHHKTSACTSTGGSQLGSGLPPTHNCTLEAVQLQSQTDGTLTWSSESLSECAGSVETTSVVWPAPASATASDEEQLVLPTPPCSTHEWQGLSRSGAAVEEQVVLPTPPCSGKKQQRGLQGLLRSVAAVEEEQLSLPRGCRQAHAGDGTGRPTSC